ncbi:MAG: hypothetical protein K5764_01770 [Prevotella sp.]|nr:hypothetical protein [Prevotella sp.]
MKTMKSRLLTLLFAGAAFVMNSCVVDDQPVTPVASEERIVLETMYVNGEIKDSLVYDDQGRVIHVDNYSPLADKGNFCLDLFDFQYTDQQIVLTHSSYVPETKSYSVVDHQYFTLDANGRVVKRTLVDASTNEVRHDYDCEFGYDGDGRLAYTIASDGKTEYQWEDGDIAGYTYQSGSTAIITMSDKKCSSYLPTYPTGTNDYLFPMGFFGKAPAHLPAKKVVYSPNKESSSVYSYDYVMDNGLMASYDFLSEFSMMGKTFKTMRTNTYHWKKIRVKQN